MTSSACHWLLSSGSLIGSASHRPPSGLNTSTWYPTWVKWKYGSVSSLHQNPTGQPVVVDTAGFEMTVATCLGRLGFVGLKSLWLIACSLVGSTGRRQLVGVKWSGVNVRISRWER